LVAVQNKKTRDQKPIVKQKSIAKEWDSPYPTEKTEIENFDEISISNNDVSISGLVDTQKKINLPEKKNSNRKEIVTKDSYFETSRAKDPMHNLCIKFAVAYIDDRDYFLNQVKTTYVESIDKLEPRFKKIIELRSDYKTVAEMKEASVSTVILPIMEQGLYSAVYANHKVAIKKILAYAKEELLILTISNTCLEGLLTSDPPEYDMMREVVNGRVQL
jgi:hypothetical protein